MVKLKKTNKTKILGICGSPRKGNSEFALKFLFDNIKGKSTEKELVLLRNLKINYKDSLISDKIQSGYMKDDIDKVLNKMKSADIIILATPTYFDMPPSLMKILIDRTSPFYSKKTLKGKKAILICCGEAKVGEGSIERNIRNLESACRSYMVKIIAKVLFSALLRNEASKNLKLKAQLKNLAKKLSK